MIFKKTDILNLDRFYRANLINSIIGIKQASLIGTISNKNITNLALFSSVVHLGSNPQLVAMFSRPNIGTPKQTLENIIDSNVFTINHVNSFILNRAHATSFNFRADESEFKKCNLGESYIKNFNAPFVKESNVSIGLSYIRHFQIDENKAVMIIGKIENIKIEKNMILDNGEIKIDKLDSIGVAGNNSYYSLSFIKALDYLSSKSPEKVVKLINKEKK